jgi:hypothetical protein
MARTIHEKLYTFGDAALASGVPPKVIRNWMDRGQVRLEADEEREGLRWRRFSMFDILRLALTKRLVDFCVPVEVASLYGDGAVSASIIHRYNNMPPQALAVGLKWTSILRLPEPVDYSDLPDTVLSVHVGRIVAKIAETLEEIDASLGEDDASDE